MILNLCFAYVTAGWTMPESGTIVTAFDLSHFKEAQPMIRSVQDHLPPGWKFVVYDLIGNWGHENLEIARQWCNVKLRAFLPPLGFQLRTWTDMQHKHWKALVIKEQFQLLDHGSALIWADASQRFHGDIKPLVKRAFEIGFLSRKGMSPIGKYTHPQMIDVLAEPEVAGDIVTHTNILDYANDHAIMIASGFGIYPKINLTERIIDAWVRCMLLERCFAPPTASGWHGMGMCVPDLKGHCHRGDQSALNVILYELLGRNATPFPPYASDEVRNQIKTFRSANDRSPENSPRQC